MSVAAPFRAALNTDISQAPFSCALAATMNDIRRILPVSVRANAPGDAAPCHGCRANLRKLLLLGKVSARLLPNVS